MCQVPRTIFVCAVYIFIKHKMQWDGKDPLFCSSTYMILKKYFLETNLHNIHGMLGNDCRPRVGSGCLSGSAVVEL